MVHEKHVVCGRAGNRDLSLEYFYRDEYAERPKAVVAVIPGGGWLHGGMDSVHNPTDWDFYLGAGMMVVGVRHRPITEAPYPACRDDVRTALDWLRTNADCLGIRRESIFLDGGSAGAHLAALTAGLESQRGQRDPVRAVVLRAPPVDIRSWYREICDIEILNDCVHKLLGGAPEDKPEVCRDASPISHVTPGMPPFLIFHGEKDMAVPLDQSESLVAALTAVGVEATLVVVRNADHGLGPVDEKGSSPTQQGIAQMKVEFLRRFLADS